MANLYYCTHCEEYTLKLNCPRCKQATVEPKPARFSPQDPYGIYRRTLKRQKQKGET